MIKDYSVIVVGAGHAGLEAALAAARMGVKTLMVTLSGLSIGRMSCNPAIGGVGKGQLVKEIDALGGEMGRAADACGIQFRILNASKGVAVQSSRAQIDMQAYERYMQGVISAQENLELLEGEVTDLIIENNEVRGVATADGRRINGFCVVISPGTFLGGVIHVGMRHVGGGRYNEPAANMLAVGLKRAGFNLLQFKTGTCPRIAKNSIDFSSLVIQKGDEPPKPFSFFTDKITNTQLPCYITYTNEKTHKIIRDNLGRSPLYAGIIRSTGVRYCPSIEDKIVKFADKSRHQVFLEPEGYTSEEIYPNGLSTSLPEDVQLELLHSIQGLEKARIVRFGYGIEHAVVEPTQLYPTLETKLVKNLYLAGQINGTTGYEEAAAQGLIAGINAVLGIKGEAPFILDRATSYIGVLIDDLTTKGTTEPYRMFTSRVEYRLVLREDNAPLRLGRFGRKLGLLSETQYKKIQDKQDALEAGIKLLRSRYIKVSPQVNARLEELGTSRLKKQTSYEELLKRPQIALKDLKSLDHLDLVIPEFALQGVEIEVKYSGFIARQLAEIERFKHLEKIRIPADLDYGNISSLSREIREKLNKFRPINLGQASRISGVTPAAISLLMVYLKKHHG